MWECVCAAPCTLRCSAPGKTGYRSEAAETPVMRIFFFTNWERARLLDGRISNQQHLKVIFSNGIRSAPEWSNFQFFLNSELLRWWTVLSALLSPAKSQGLTESWGFWKDGKTHICVYDSGFSQPPIGLGVNLYANEQFHPSLDLFWWLSHLEGKLLKEIHLPHPPLPNSRSCEL